MALTHEILNRDFKHLNRRNVFKAIKRLNNTIERYYELENELTIQNRIIINITLRDERKILSSVVNIYEPCKN